MSRPFTLPVVIACSAHALLLFGFKKAEVTLPTKPPVENTESREYPLLPPEEIEKPDPVETREKSAGGKLVEPPPMSMDRSAEVATHKDFVMERNRVELPPIKADRRTIPAGPDSSNGDPNAPEYGPGAPDGKPSIFSITALDNAPRARVQNPPSYPFSLKASGISGEVVVEFIVDERGRVTHPRVVSSTHPDFEAATLHAVSKWRFEPGTRKMKPVSFRMMVPVKFNLND